MIGKYKVGAYVRLSKGDNYSESDSINNQKNLVKDYINENEEWQEMKDIVELIQKGIGDE